MTAPTQAVVGPFPTPARAYDATNEANFRRQVEIYLRRMSTFAVAVAPVAPFDPADHADRHEEGGSDPLDLASIAGLLPWAKLTDVPTEFPPEAHALVGAAHTASGLTTGHFLRATSATTFAFGAAASTDLSDSANLARLDAANVFSHATGQQATRLGLGVAPHADHVLHLQSNDNTVLFSSSDADFQTQRAEMSLRSREIAQPNRGIFVAQQGSGVTNATLQIGGDSTRAFCVIGFQTAPTVDGVPTTKWTINLSGFLIPAANLDIGAVANRVRVGYFNSINVATGITFGTPLEVASGGTGRATLTSANLLVGAGTSAVSFLAPGTAGQVVRSTGSAWASAALAFSDLSGSIADGQVPGSAVTQHQAALAINASQVGGASDAERTFDSSGQYQFTGSLVIGTDPGGAGLLRVGGNIVAGTAFLSSTTPLRLGFADNVDIHVSEGTLRVINAAYTAANFTIDQVGNVTIAGLLTTVASASGSAGLRLPHGAAPTSPVDGDMWTTTSGVFVRINGTTFQLDMT